MKGLFYVKKKIKINELKNIEHGEVQPSFIHPENQRRQIRT